MASPLQGLRVWLCVLGCRSNLYEGEALAGELALRGAKVSEDLDGADAALLVSCSVTSVADKKCRQAVRKAQREFNSRGKNGTVAVCGCWAQALNASEARELGVNLLVGNRLKHKLPAALEKAVQEAAENFGKNSGEIFIDMRLDVGSENLWDELTLEKPLLRTRAFLKIQEGCDRFCSYCVIPFLRGRSVSRPAEDVLREARRVADNGCGEIILTGIHLGDYGRHAGRNDGRHDGRGSDESLAGLIEKLSGVPGVKRLRLGSLEPFALSGELLRALADSPVFCRHLHLPVQSGDDEVLARMRRGYGAEDFLRVCGSAREALGGDLHISSDVMTGFPGESGGAFENTLKLMEKAALGRAHVFPYSPRVGTDAAGLPNQVPRNVAAERARAAAALGDSLLERYVSRFAGRVLSVLVEGKSTEEKSGGFFSGYTENFVAAEIRSGSEPEVGKEIEVRVTGHSGGKLFAEAQSG